VGGSAGGLARTILGRRAVLRGLVGVAGLAVGAPTLGLLDARRTAHADLPPPPGKLRYILVPHPDDEFDAWSRVGNETDHYKVFILLTQGECSAFADGHGVKTGHDMIPPRPSLSRTSSKATRKAARVNSWHGFLDGMGALDWTLGLSPTVMVVSDPVPGGPYSFELLLGPRSARAVFDLGDSALTRGHVLGALEAVRRARWLFPAPAEDDVVGAAYVNGGWPDAVIYAHPDHVAVQDALRSGGGVPGATYGRTVASDPVCSLTVVLSQHIYDTAMAVSPGPPDPFANPDATAVGVFQRHYGWLAFDMRTQQGTPYWPAGDTPDITQFCRIQSFWTQ
jgi:hypothetical protein